MPYICRYCNSQVPDGANQCPACRKWHITSEYEAGTTEPIRLSDIDSDKTKRLITGPWDLCFGGGLVLQSVILAGGAPGAGKSTLMLQYGDSVAEKYGDVLYLAAEEAPEQIKDRAVRLKLKNTKHIHVWPTLGGTTIISEMLESIENFEIEPRVIIADSLPGLAGDNYQLQSEICLSLKSYAIEHDCPSIIIDHITKESEFAGRIALQHLVDATLSFYPDKHDIRILKPHKNRHGSIAVSSAFDMRDEGLVHVYDTVAGTRKDAQSVLKKTTAEPKQRKKHTSKSKTDKRGQETTQTHAHRQETTRTHAHAQGSGTSLSSEPSPKTGDTSAE